jgi:predicted dehydrogenase
MRARSIAQQYGIQRWYDTYAGLIADETVDAVSVVTAETDHREPVIKALQAGKHVLVEKPIARTFEDAQAMIQAARAAPGILMPGHLLRFETKYATMQQMVAAGGVGRLVAFAARRNRPRSLVERYGRVHPALVTAIHDVDIMLWLAQDRVQRVRALDRLRDRDHGAHGAWALLEFEHGIIGTLQTVWLVPDAAGLATDDAFEVIGIDGTIKIQFDAPALWAWQTGGTVVPDVSYEPRVHGEVTAALKEELAYFVQCARNRRPPARVTPEDGLHALSVVLAMIESARSGKEVIPAHPPAII